MPSTTTTSSGAAFTGRPDPCTGQPLTPDKDVATLHFDPRDLGSGQAMLHARRGCGR